MHQTTIWMNLKRNCCAGTASWVIGTHKTFKNCFDQEHWAQLTRHKRVANICLPQAPRSLSATDWTALSLSDCKLLAAASLDHITATDGRTQSQGTIHDAHSSNSPMFHPMSLVRTFAPPPAVNSLITFVLTAGQWPINFLVPSGPDIHQDC